MHKDTIKYGVLYSIISILSVMITYYINPKELFNFFSLKTIIGFAIMFGFMYLAAKKARERAGGFIPFGEALVPAFLIYAIGGFIGALFMHFLMNYYDPSLHDVVKEFQRGVTQSTGEMMGLSEDQILEMVEETELKQAEKNSSGIVEGIMGYLFGCLWMGLPFAAIAAAIVKKKEPELV